jgi:acyl-coenzyme A synthetase/AMP-(fatty) acid ligase
MCLPTVFWTELAAAVSPGSLAPRVRLATVGGSAMPPDHVEAWLSAARSETVLINGYGPTETTVCASWKVVRAAPRESRIAIGQALPGATVYVLDPRMQPVPPGIPGEIFIGGRGVARGYAGRPDLTAERFLPDPFSHESGARLYRTGDRGRYRSSGDLELLGRMDNEIKVRGYRVNPEELERVLCALPAVVEAAAVPISRQDDTALIAFVTTAPGVLFDRADLLRHAREHLPEYMLPEHVFEVPALPRTAAGKIDRQALKSLEVPEPTTPSATPPATSAEILIAAIWCECLGIAPSSSDNFFSLGGHSLLALRVVARIAAAVNVDVPLRVVFERPTVAGLAQYVEAMQWVGQAGAPARIGPS